MTTATHGMTIDYETADRITLLTLKDQLDMLEKEVLAHTTDGAYMHAEDFQEAIMTLLPALRVLVKYYGGSVD
jgi:membrane-bound lytic murein transglycosylase MltF